MSDNVYAWSVSVNNIGGLLGGLSGGALACFVPYWYGLLVALLFNVVGFLIYAIAQQGWMIILARLLIGIFSGLQRSLVFAYISVSYQSYVETKRYAGKKVNLTKYCRVKDLVFSLYTISASAGFFVGSGNLCATCTLGLFLILFGQHCRFFSCSGPIYWNRSL